MNDDYIKNLENIIKKMLQPLKNIPFKLVIEAISGYRIIPFDKNDERDKKVLDVLKKVADISGENINRKGIIRPRANEVGNDVENFVKEALIQINYSADTPKTTSGTKKATGYPDIEFIDEFSRLNYLECKTFNIKNISTTQRSFYMSPSEDFKITQDAHHFVISFEMFVDDTQGKNKIYKTKSWKILSLENLMVDIKNEFQSDNKRLYSRELILDEGEFFKTGINKFI